VLKHPVLAGNERVRKAAANLPPMARGETGTGIAILQAALVDLGYKLPTSMRKTGVPDGVFGDETHGAVLGFQRKESLSRKDGIAGRDTLERLDVLLLAAAPSKKVPSPILPSGTAEYGIGSADPPARSDPGAGPWNSKPKTTIALVQRETILETLPPRGLSAMTFIGKDAARHMKHYLDGSGRTLTIDLEGMVRDVPSAQMRFLNEVSQAKRFVEALPVGVHLITSKRGEGAYNSKSENQNWFYAIGGYTSWGRGKATLKSGHPQREYELEFEYRFYDRYNWDGGKSVTIASVTITDDFMGEFHRQGIAREFDCVGSIQRKFVWKQGQPIPAQQFQPAGGR
jgi:peptidoglycan hydrolase-like protein with peptidoglycan-binding domain